VALLLNLIAIICSQLYRSAVFYHQTYRPYDASLSPRFTACLTESINQFERHDLCTRYLPEVPEKTGQQLKCVEFLALQSLLFADA